MTVTIYGADGNPKRRSRNLRGLLDHARRTPPYAVGLAENFDGTYTMDLEFANGDTSLSVWQDWRVAADWLTARRSWGDLNVSMPSHKGFYRRYVMGERDE